VKAAFRIAIVILGFSAGWGSTLASAETVADGQIALSSGRQSEALRIWTDLAEHGSGEAAYSIGLLYDLGNGVRSNAATAYDWYLRAAQTGLPAAAFNVAVLLDSGRGVGQDLSAASVWYARAAAAGHARSQYNLAQLYEAGEGVPRNPRAAEAWFRRAAEGGLSAATSRLDALHLVTRSLKQLEVVGTLPVAPLPVAPEGRVAQLAPIAFVWKQPAQSISVKSFVEIVSLGQQGSREVFANYSDVSAITVDLQPQNYAWRVFAVSWEPAHYVASSWMRFTVYKR
jgi:hypothetical protein